MALNPGFADPNLEDMDGMEPQAKRRRGPGHSGSLDSWVALPVLSDEQSDEVELVEAFAAPVVDKKLTSGLVRRLNELLPLSDLQHVKRVRPVTEKSSPHPLEVLLCLVAGAPGGTAEGVKSLLPPDRLGLEGLGEPFVVRVPSRPPLTRPQFEVASRHWPTSFHEDKQLSVALRGALFSSSQRASMHAHMLVALAAAKQGRDLGMEAVGAAVVDPATDTIVAAGHDCRGAHPLHHAVLVCIDLVARRQGGGRYGFDDFPACRFTQTPLEETASARAYICTGYDLYVTREPCVMCAMALVHARIGRVFYGTPFADGALGSKYKIHTMKELNHRFQVFEGVLGEQCQELQATSRS